MKIINIMGSGISSCQVKSEINAPKIMIKQNLKILALYDRLDQNGNMAIEQEEFYVLANHHIKNQRINSKRTNEK